MTHIHAAALGLLQGIGEFLPISSSAHLAIAPWLMGWDYQGLAYDVMLHMGTLLAISLYFAKDWAGMIKAGLSRPASEEGRLLWLIALATLPAAIAGYFLEHAAENLFRGPVLMAANLIIFAAVLMIADKKSGGGRTCRAFNFRDAAVVGLAQALAILPGVSRSGITMTAALLAGYRRDEAARISFLLSGPVILGATVMEMRKFQSAAVDGPFLTGILTSFAVGWLSIKFLLSYLKTRNFDIFVIYRVILGILILAGVLYSNG